MRNTGTGTGSWPVTNIGTLAETNHFLSNKLSYNYNLTLKILPNLSHNHLRKFSKSKITKSQRYLEHETRPPAPTNPVQTERKKKRKTPKKTGTLSIHPSVRPTQAYPTEPLTPPKLPQNLLINLVKDTFPHSPNTDQTPNTYSPAAPPSNSESTINTRTTPT